MPAPNPTMLFHIGDPRMEEPHKSMERVDKLFTEHPEIKLIVVVWDREAHEAVTKHVAGKNAECWLWEEDGPVMNRLMDNLAAVVGANLIQPMWYLCPDNHISPSTGGQIRETCVADGCGKPVAHHLPIEERFKDFAGVFEKVIRLSNFDTRSGDWLNAQVSPTANWGWNMRHATGGATTRALKRAGAGKPILICAAGPSLEDAIPHLKRLQDKCLISCVGRSYRLLRKHGIRVDYTITCDMFDWDAAIFDGLTAKDVGDTVLCYASVASPRVVDCWPGDKVCLWDINTARMMGREDWIYGGNSVAHHQLNFAAQILQCDPIVMVGTDLAYTKPEEEKTHAEGTFAEGWPEEIRKAERLRQAELWVPSTATVVKDCDLYPECHRTHAWFGQGAFRPMGGVIEVRSSPAYRDFGTLFEMLIAKHKANGTKAIYNACPNGALIDGTTPLNLARYLEDLPPTPAETCLGREVRVEVAGD